ncbi:ATP-binding protein [Streptomyces sp. MMBL 11-3]|uniref:ATP-binding protein n=1 Tax=Streptomyces sp. MMBL 11-3 TaxID=3382639 RepID=UPI0039B6BF52
MESDGTSSSHAAAGQRPIRTGYALDGAAGCIAQARHHVLAFLDRAAGEHLLAVSARVRDLTQLVVSELVTNALKYAPGPALMELDITTQRVEVIVWDSASVMPVARPADSGRIGQHGLEIVKAVSEYVAVRQEPVGKRVTAHIALPDPPGELALHGPA